MPKGHKQKNEVRNNRKKIKVNNQIHRKANENQKRSHQKRRTKKIKKSKSPKNNLIIKLKQNMLSLQLETLHKEHQTQIFQKQKIQ